MSEDSAWYLEYSKVRSGFERAAQSYEGAAVLQREIGSRLLERLDYMRIRPGHLLDLGCGTGYLSAALLKRYPKTKLVALDLARNMVQQARRKGGWWHKPIGICADASRLPLQEKCVDMVISNLMLPWCNDLSAVFRELVRVSRPEGLFLFSTLGPDTLKELRASWQQVDGYPHICRFVDMHDVGDALLQAGFRDPVVDMEMLTLTYQEISGLLNDLKDTGAGNAAVGRRRGLTGKQCLRALQQAYDTFRMPDGRYPASYEVIYGHAWAPPVASQGLPAAYIPVKPVGSRF